MRFETLAGKRKNGFNRIVWVGCALLLVVVIVLELVIVEKGGIGSNGKNPESSVAPQKSTASPSEPTPIPTPEATPYIYVNESGNTVGTRFYAPNGYTKVTLEKGSFGEYLRNYSLKAYGERSKTFNDLVNDDTPSLGILNQKDALTSYQQCADTVIMLYAEYLYGLGRYSEIAFQFSSGFLCDYTHYTLGYEAAISGKNVTWKDKTGKAGKGAPDYSYETFTKYLQKIYEYANTDSLVSQFKSTTEDNLKVGDIIVAPYKDLKNQAIKQGLDTSKIGLGHAMIIGDIAVNEKGEKVFLLIEGSTPATTPYVVEDPNNPGCMWFSFDENGEFVKSSSGIKWQNTWLYTFENK